MEFNDFCWHDAIIKNIEIDRHNPGNDDSIRFQIIWPEEEEKGFLLFEDVYWASMKLNFGIVADESILNANQLDDDNEDLIQFHLKWKGTMKGEKLNIYRIELNSSGGEIKIIAKNFKVYKR